MLKQTCFQIAGTVSISGSVAITFPTTTVAKTQQNNVQVALAAGASTQVLAANANRKFLQVVNLSGATLYIAFGAAAAVTSFPVPNGGVFTQDISTLGSINQQVVNMWNPTGGPLNVNAYEEQ